MSWTSQRRWRYHPPSMTERLILLTLALAGLTACSHSGDNLQQRQTDCFTEHPGDVRRCMAVH